MIHKICIHRLQIYQLRTCHNCHKIIAKFTFNKKSHFHNISKTIIVRLIYVHHYSFFQNDYTIYWTINKFVCERHDNKSKFVKGFLIIVLLLSEFFNQENYLCRCAVFVGAANEKDVLTHKTTVAGDYICWEKSTDYITKMRHVIYVW